MYISSVVQEVYFLCDARACAHATINPSDLADGNTLAYFLAEL